MLINILVLLHEYIKTIISFDSLNELRIVDFGGDTDAYNVFVHRGFLFKYPIGEDLLETPSLLGKIKKYYRDKKDIKKVFDDINNERVGTDWMMGTVHDEILMFSSRWMVPNPKISKIVKDVVIALDLKGVNKTAFNPYTDDDEVSEHPRHEILGKLPDIAFHGTNSKSLMKILRVGLVPGATIQKSGFKREKVWHDKTTFLEFDINETLFYAQNAVEKFGGFPIVLGIRIPDKERIEPDFDVDTAMGKTTYKDIAPEKKETKPARFAKGPLKASMDIGRIGYAGRIPPKFIEKFFYYSIRQNELVETTKEKLFQMIEIADNFGDESYEEDYEDLEPEE
jgi:hypothetical protein